MFVTALVLASAIAASAPPPATAPAKPAATAAAKADPKVTEADRADLTAALAKLHSLEAVGQGRFDRHEMTRKELQKLHNLTRELEKDLSCIGKCGTEQCCSDGLCAQSCNQPHHH
jgi:Spy/CpxP family protein refolding chaperone